MKMSKSRLAALMVLIPLSLALIATGCDTGGDSKPTTYSVTFNSNTTDNVTNMPDNLKGIKKGAKITEPVKIPARTGWTFAGWLDAPAGAAWNFATNTVTKNTILYAKWTEVVASVTATLDLNYTGAPAPTTQTVASGGRITRPATDPTRTGYKFVNWFNQATGGTVWAFTTTITADTTIYAQWIQTFTVTFIPNAPAGTTVAGMPGNATVDSGGLVTQPTTPPTITGGNYAFDGWYTAATGGTQFVFATATITANTEIHARWVPQYTVTFNLNAATGQTVTGQPPVQTIRSGQAATMPSTPPSSDGGYLFKFWSSTQVEGTEYVWSTPVTANIILYAQWDAKATVTFVVNMGTPVAPQVIDRGGLVDETETTTTRAGHVFDGWWTTAAFTAGTEFDFDTPVTTSFNLYAKWIPYSSGTSTVTFAGFGPETIDISAATPLVVTDPTSKFTVTVTGTWDSYTWFLDSDLIIGADEDAFTLTGDAFDSVADVRVKHTLTVIVTKDGVPYSKEVIFAVTW